MIIDIENTDGVVAHKDGSTIKPGDGHEYTLAWVRTGRDVPVVTAHVDYSAYDGACDYPHTLKRLTELYGHDGFASFEFVAAGETIKVNEAIAVNSRTNKPCEGTAWLALDNTEEYEPHTLQRLTEIYGHESEVLEAMKDALAAVEVECEYCKQQHCPFDEEDLHNCSAHWVPAEWEREADGMQTSVSILMAISDVTGVAFGCTNTGGRSAADAEWCDGYRSEEVLKKAWELVDEDEDMLCWGPETYKRG